jgi:hypothetical protein
MRQLPREWAWKYPLTSVRQDACSSALASRLERELYPRPPEGAGLSPFFFFPIACKDHLPMTSPAVPAAGAAAPCAKPRTVRAYFFVSAPADPGLLPRLIEPVAKLGAVPTRVHASRESGNGTELTVDLRLAGVAPRTADLVERALRAVVGVRQVKSVVESEGSLG